MSFIHVWMNGCFSLRLKWKIPQGIQHCIFFGRTDAEAEATIFWPPGVKSSLTGKDSDSAEDWMQKEKGVAEYEMVW